MLFRIIAMLFLEHFLSTSELIAVIKCNKDSLCAVGSYFLHGLIGSV